MIIARKQATCSRSRETWPERHLSMRFFSLSTAGTQDSSMARSMLCPSSENWRKPFHAVQNRTWFPHSEPVDVAAPPLLARQLSPGRDGRESLHVTCLYTNAPTFGAHTGAEPIPLQRLLEPETGRTPAAVAVIDLAGVGERVRRRGWRCDPGRRGRSLALPPAAPSSTAAFTPTGRMTPGPDRRRATERR